MDAGLMVVVPGIIVAPSVGVWVTLVAPGIGRSVITLEGISPMLISRLSKAHHQSLAALTSANVTTMLVAPTGLFANNDTLSLGESVWKFGPATDSQRIT